MREVEGERIVQFSSVPQSCPALCDPMDCSIPGFPVHHQLPELAQTHVHRVSDAIQPSHPLSYPSPLAPNPSQHQGLFQWVIFSNESTLRMRWPKYWSFSFSIIPPKEHPGLISFRMDWLDLLETPGKQIAPLGGFIPIPDVRKWSQTVNYSSKLHPSKWWAWACPFPYIQGPVPPQAGADQRPEPEWEKSRAPDLGLLLCVHEM